MVNRNILKLNKGMTYVELIVVLGIFALLGSVVLFNYHEFQQKINIKTLASDVALKIVEAQNAALSGEFPPPGYSTSTTWRPSYGIFIDENSDNKSFVYFVDLDNNNSFDGASCTGECIEKVSITKGNFVSDIDVYYQGNATPYSLDDITISFTRPNGSAILESTTSFASTVSYIQITVSSPDLLSAKIKVYTSGRIEIN